MQTLGLPVRQGRDRSQRLNTINASAEFIENACPLAVDSQYVPELDKFVPISEARSYADTISTMWKDSYVERDNLINSTNQLKQKSRRLDNSENFTWRQVIAEVQNISDAYHHERGRVRNIFHRMCDNATVFENWLDLLPNGDYGAVISGAFIIVLRAARQISEVRQMIYETLAEIPDTLTHASAYIDIYKAHSSELLIRHTAALCKCILALLSSIVQFFLRSSFKRGVAALLKGNAFEQELRDQIQQMKNQVLRLREEANLCLQERLADMDRKNDLREIREKSRQQLAKEELLLAIDSSSKITAQTVCTYLLRQLQASPNFNLRTGSFKPLLESPGPNVDQGVPSPDLIPQSGPQSGTGRTAEDILELLRYDNKAQRKDIEHSLSLGYTQCDAAHTRSMWVLHTAEMSDFLAGKAGSDILLVNGNSAATDFISPLSFVCAKIADLISISDQIILITHFCGYHTDELRDLRANVRGMLGSLLGQLFMQVENWNHRHFRLDLSSVTDQNCKSIQKEDLDALFDIFRTTVLQLPENTIIFCLIDSLSAYENSARKQHTIYLMRKFARLIKKSKNVTLKLLVTFPGRSVYADHWAGFQNGTSRVLDVPLDL